MITKLYLDLLQIIFNKLDFLSQIRFRQVCKYFYNDLQVIDFYNIAYKFTLKLTDDILKNYPNIKLLNSYNNPNIKKVNQFLKNLKILDSSYNSGITYFDLIGLDLSELNVQGNKNIRNINHLKNLKVLNCAFDSGIRYKDLLGLNLI